MEFPIIIMKEVSKDKFEPEYEVHADGVKEIKEEPCQFCNVRCGNEWCNADNSEEE